MNSCQHLSVIILNILLADNDDADSAANNDHNKDAMVITKLSLLPLKNRRAKKDSLF